MREDTRLLIIRQFRQDWETETVAELEALEEALSAPASLDELREIRGGFAAECASASRQFPRWLAYRVAALRVTRRLWRRRG